VPWFADGQFLAVRTPANVSFRGAVPAEMPATPAGRTTTVSLTPPGARAS